MYSPVSGSQPDGVDREIAPARRVGKRHARVAVDREAVVSAARLRLASGQRDVDGADLVDGKALADALDAAEAREQRAAARSAGMPKTSRSRSFDVEAEQPVAHEAADDQGAASRGTDGCRNRPRQRESIFIGHSPGSYIERVVSRCLGRR